MNLLNRNEDFSLTMGDDEGVAADNSLCSMYRKGELRVPIHLKMTLTIKEAAAYSSIGINKIESMLKMPNCPFVLYIGNKKLVKRREFEEYIRSVISI